MILIYVPNEPILTKYKQNGQNVTKKKLISIQMFHLGPNKSDKKDKKPDKMITELQLLLCASHVLQVTLSHEGNNIHY